jgi:hypothetical protein
MIIGFALMVRKTRKANKTRAKERKARDFAGDVATNDESD